MGDPGVHAGVARLGAPIPEGHEADLHPAATHAQQQGPSAVTLRGEVKVKSSYATTSLLKYHIEEAVMKAANSECYRAWVTGDSFIVGRKSERTEELKGPEKCVYSRRLETARDLPERKIERMK